MFDVGFWELCLIGVISLVVIGPERLPKVARLTGFWLGKIRSMASTVKTEVMHEFREEEIRQALKEQAGLDEINQVVEDTSKSIHAIKTEAIKTRAGFDNSQHSRTK